MLKYLCTFMLTCLYAYMIIRLSVYLLGYLFNCLLVCLNDYKLI